MRDTRKRFSEDCFAECRNTRYAGGVANPNPNTSGLSPGGHSLTAGADQSPRISVSIPGDWKQRLDQIAAERGTGTSKLVRQVIGEWLARQGASSHHG